ncbi:MAG: T9SS type A sorting domain-containing protein, partial [Flavobacteriales bacterium]
YLSIHINGPGVEFVGDTYDFTYSLELMDDQELPFYSYNGSNTLTVSCSYDPNDKQATPAGYAEPHYILADTEIEYKIRFQNTGNAPAFNVHIDDQLDITKLDLSTFEPVAASHSYYTIVNPDGFIQFVFDNIMLPDSASDEPGSQGFVIYKIRPYADITPESVIENTGYIYFDENPPVITNTTYHTIYHCDMMPQSTEDLSSCEGESFSLTSTYPYVESVQWLVNNDVVSDEPEFTVPSSEGSYFIQMILTNPLCSSTSSYYYNVYGAPVINVSNEAGSIIAEGADTYVWFLNNEVIEGETDGVIENAGPGYYVAQGTTAFGCTGTSDVFMYVGVEETTNAVFNLYPNPASNSVNIIANDALGQMISITDASGRLIRTEKINTSNVTMDVSDLSDGLYFVRIGAEQRLLAVKK